MSQQVQVITAEPILISGREVARLLGVSYEAVMHGDGICARLIKVNVGSPGSQRSRWNFDYEQVKKIAEDLLAEARRQQSWRKDLLAEAHPEE